MEVELKGTRGENSLNLLIHVVRVVGDCGESRIAVLFETGASHSFIRRGLAETIATPAKLPKPIVFALADNRPFEINEAILLSIDFGRVDIPVCVVAECVPNGDLLT